MEDSNAPRPDEDGPEDQPQPGEDQIEAAREAAREARREMDKAQNDVERRAEEIASRANRSRKTMDHRLKPDKNSITGNGETGRSLGVGLTIAYGIIGAPIAGWLAGLGIDRAMGHETGIGNWLVVLGAIGAVVFAIVTLQRQKS